VRGAKRFATTADIGRKSNSTSAPIRKLSLPMGSALSAGRSWIRDCPRRL